MDRLIIRLAVAVGLTLVAAPSFAVFLVNTDFEANSLGGLNGQASTGPNPWLSSGGTIVNTGPVQGTQAVNYTSVLAAGQFDHHSRVNLASSGGVAMQVGWTITASVDVYNEWTTPDNFTGIAMWSNSHSVEHSLFGMSGGFAWTLARHGTGPAAPLLGNASNPPNTGWHTISLVVTQTSVNTLTTTYLLDGNPFTYNGFTYNTHTDTVGLVNQVFDFSLVTMNYGSSTGAITGIYDNYKVEMVPEPASLVALGLGTLGVMRRRRGVPK